MHFGPLCIAESAKLDFLALWEGHKLGFFL